jgi:LEA14-like dessication related protein
MKKFIVLLLGLVLMSGSCEDIKGTFNMSKCKYDYESITGVRLGGVEVKNTAAVTVAVGMSFLLGGELPLDFLLNLKVTNSYTQAASLNGGSYILQVDDIEMTRGKLPNSFEVGAGQTNTLSIAMNFDLKQFFSELKAVSNLVLNFAGMGEGTPSQVKVLLRPTFRVAGITFDSPTDIPISFTVGK